MSQVYVESLEPSDGGSDRITTVDIFKLNGHQLGIHWTT